MPRYEAKPNHGWSQQCLDPTVRSPREPGTPQCLDPTIRCPRASGFQQWLSPTMFGPSKRPREPRPTKAQSARGDTEREVLGIDQICHKSFFRDPLQQHPTENNAQAF